MPIQVPRRNKYVVNGGPPDVGFAREPGDKISYETFPDEEEDLFQRPVEEVGDDLCGDGRRATYIYVKDMYKKLQNDRKDINKMRVELQDDREDIDKMRVELQDDREQFKEVLEEFKIRQDKLLVDEDQLQVDKDQFSLDQKQFSLEKKEFSKQKIDLAEERKQFEQEKAQSKAKLDARRRAINKRKSDLAKREKEVKRLKTHLEQEKAALKEKQHALEQGKEELRQQRNAFREEQDASTDCRRKFQQEQDRFVANGVTPEELTKLQRKVDELTAYKRYAEPKVKFCHDLGLLVQRRGDLEVELSRTSRFSYRCCHFKFGEEPECRQVERKLQASKDTLEGKLQSLVR